MSDLLGGRAHFWCEVRSLVLRQCSYARVVRWKARVASSLTDVWQQLFEQKDITVIMHHSLSPLSA